MEGSNQYQKLTSFKFWRSYVIHMRPYLLFISGSAGLVGMALGNPYETTSLKNIIAFIAFFLAYGFGQALTDCFQVDTDRISSPYRPLSRGIVSAKSIMAISMIGLIACSVIFIYLNPWNIILTLMSIIGLATYTYFKKNYWYIGPFYNSWIVALLPVMGYLISNSDQSEQSIRFLIGVIALNFLSYASFVLIGYLKDISADREASYKTITVLFGWNKTVWLADFCVLSSIIISYQFQTVFTQSFYVWCAASLLAVSGQLYAHFTTEKKESNATLPIIMTVRSFILWNMSIMLSFQPATILFVAVFYIMFEITIYFRPMREQI